MRRSDRLETLAVALAATVVLLAVPFAAAFGTSVKEARSLTYAQQAIDRHQTTATALADARVHVQADSQTFAVNARWSAKDGVHVSTVDVPDMVRAGDRFDIWIGADGNHAGAPASSGLAAIEAVGWAVLSWIAVATAVAAGVYILRRRLDRIRYADWAAELYSLADDGGGRASHEQ